MRTKFLIPSAITCSVLACATVVYGSPDPRVQAVTTAKPAALIPPGGASAKPGVRPPATPAPLSLANLRVTLGKVQPAGAGLAIRDAKVRFVAPSTTPAAHVAFTYAGPTKDTAALASGIVRRQIGLKLKALNGCNLVYAMWRLEPVNELVVSVKSNPGKTTHAQCGTNGYADIPGTQKTPPKVLAGSKHSLDAALSGSHLVVFADGGVVWEGDLPKVAWDGPSGMRTDNVSVDFQFGAPALGSSQLSTKVPGLSFAAEDE